MLTGQILSSVRNLSLADRAIHFLNSFPSPISRSNFKRMSDSILYDINLHHHSCKILPTNTPLLLAAPSLGQSPVPNHNMYISCFLFSLKELLHIICLSRYCEHATYLLSTLLSSSNCPTTNTDQWLSNFIMPKNHLGHL